jgi:hypothetical protein
VCSGTSIDVPWSSLDGEPSQEETDGVSAGVTTSETLWIALAGGAVGVLITGAAWAALRLSAVPSDLRRHDFEARVVNEDLELWAVDQYREVRRQLRRAENSTDQVDWIFSGAYGQARSSIKTEALHRWRDRRHSAERSLIEIESKEGPFHRLLRRRRRFRDGLGLHAVGRVEPIIDEFRQPVTKHGHDHLVVFDPTSVRLEDIVEQIREDPLEPEVSPRVEYQRTAGGGHRRIVHDEPPPATDDLPGLSGPVVQEDV